MLHFKMTLWSVTFLGSGCGKNLVTFECSQKGEYVLLLHDISSEILVLSCSKLTM